MATSSAGVVWSFCKPEKERRLALDVHCGTFKNDGSPDFACGARINLRIPREFLTTQYFFVNVEPLIRLVR